MARLRSFVHLESNDRALLVRAAMMLVAVRLGLRLLPYVFLRRVVRAMTQRTPKKRSVQHRPDSIAWSVMTASQYVPGAATCLPRALAAHLLLAQSGHVAQFRIGVARCADGAIEAHAWVETDGKIVVGAVDGVSRFVPLPNAQGSAF